MAAEALYAKQENTYVLKLTGEVRYPLSYGVEAFIKRLTEETDYQMIALDLTEAVCIDSTMLGLLAQIALIMRQRFNALPQLISVNRDVNELLNNVGFDRLFTFCNDLRLTVDFQPLATPEPSKRALTQTLLTAHRTLSALNEQNREVFQPVVEVLQRRVEVQTSASSGSPADESAPSSNTSPAEPPSPTTDSAT